MMPLSKPPVADTWRSFLIDLTFARNYTAADWLSHPGPPPRNPVVDRLLPSLLQVKAVAILDHALQSWIEEHGLTVPRQPYGRDLNGRINFLADRSEIADRESLHSIRGTRNELAHVPSGSVNWEELDRDVLAIHRALFGLGLVPAMQKWGVIAEKLAARPGTSPDVDLSMDYAIRIMHEEKPVAEIAWTMNMMRDE
jgi:hypothetical protein